MEIKTIFKLQIMESNYHGTILFLIVKITKILFQKFLKILDKENQKVLFYNSQKIKCLRI
jgi:hypothetical protein